ncbi:MAG: hypothetical protein IH628_16385 [Proteobacteria bacterium]|nr:hypothetical protein [Pseudomonadota bacterium]
MMVLALAGVVCASAGVGSSFFSVSPLGETEFWYTSPSYFWIRFGVLLLLMSSFWFLEQLFKGAPGLLPFRSQWVVTLGRESYFVYIIHLFLIFGWLLNPLVNIRAYAGGQLAWTSSLALIGLLTATLAVLSSVWHVLKKEHPLVVQGLLSWFWLTMFYYIVVNPF